MVETELKIELKSRLRTRVLKIYGEWGKRDQAKLKF